MTEAELEVKFQNAMLVASQIPQSSLPPDVQLRLYAYYKQATFGVLEQKQSTISHLRDAFKMNAWMQISNLSVREAKEKYIEVVNSLEQYQF